MALLVSLPWLGAGGPAAPQVSILPPGVAPDGLVAAYDMTSRTDDGRLRDFGPHGLHGVILGGTEVDSPSGSARLFRTVEDRVDLPEHPAFDLDGPLTIAARLRVDRGGLHQHVAACDDKWALWVTPDDRVRLGDTRGGGYSAPPGSAGVGRWLDVVVILAATAGDALGVESAMIWIDGARAPAPPHLRTADAGAARAWSPGPLYPDDACYLGFESHQGDEAHRSLAFVGALDELLLFDRVWSEAEVIAFSSP